MYNTALKDYVKIYKGFYDQNFCKQIVNELKEVTWNKHAYYINALNKVVQNENELDISLQSTESKSELDKKIWSAINQYICVDMSYMNKWFNAWSGYSLARFNKYSVGTEMKVHCDHIQSLFDGNKKGIPFLTVLGLLNNNYEGGKFFLCGEEVDMSTGDVIVFPSNFLYPHEVKKVTSGERYSFVSWVW